MRRYIRNALELAAANAHNWHPDFIVPGSPGSALQRVHDTNDRYRYFAGVDFIPLNTNFWTRLFSLISAV
jgi:hypothetical protein